MGWRYGRGGAVGWSWGLGELRCRGGRGGGSRAVRGIRRKVRGYDICIFASLGDKETRIDYNELVETGHRNDTVDIIFGLVGVDLMVVCYVVSVPDLDSDIHLLVLVWQSRMVW